MNETLIVLGAVALAGGIGVAGWATYAIDDMGLMRYINEDEYEAYSLFRLLGVLSAVAGLVALVIGLVVDTRPTTRDYHMRQIQYPISAQGTIFCMYCGRPIAPDAVYCPGCGRFMKNQP